MRLYPCMALIVLAGVANTAVGEGLEQRLVDCAGIADEQQRLACYDELASSFVPGPGVTVESRSPGQFGLEHKTPEPVTEIRARVTGIGKNPLGKMLLTLDNGQTWQQKDSKRLIVHVGDEILIERGALSAFYLSAGDNRRISVSRVK